MPRSKNPSQPTTLVCVVLAMAFTILSALGVLALQIKLTREHEDEALAHATLTQLDDTFDQATHAVALVQRLPADAPCDESTLVLLRETVASLSQLQSLGLFRGNTVYCSSLYGDRSTALPPVQPPGGRTLELVDAGAPGNPSGRANLMLRDSTAANGVGVMATIDTQHLRAALHSAYPGPHLILQVGDATLDTQGAVVPASSHPKNIRQVASSRHSASVLLAPSHGLSIGSWSAYWPSYLFIAALSVLVGLMVGRLTQRLYTTRRLVEDGMRRDEFVPYFQPVVSSTDASVLGVEVLVRWHTARAGVLSPDQFIPAAEREGMIVPLTHHLMEKTGGMLVANIDRVPRGMQVAFNVCAEHFSLESLLQDCQRFLDRTSARGLQLMLELTERQPIAEDEQTDRILKRLREMGVKLAIDDFGTGNSSLAYLHRFNFDIIKIDRMFVGMARPDTISHHIIDSIIDLALNMNFEIVTEGVETEEQVRYLRQQVKDRGSLHMQGYLFARPMMLEDLIVWLRQRRAIPA